MAGYVRLALALACITMLYKLANAQTNFVTDLSVRPAATIEELLVQAADVFEQERLLLQEHPTGPAAITIGDSITAFGYDPDGWVTLLKQNYPQVTFVNKGVPMGNTRSSLIISNWTLGNERSPLYKQASRLKLVTFCFGANDASINIKNATWRFIPLAEYKANLITSINVFRTQGVNNILLLTPPPAASPPRIDRRLNATAEYAEAVKQIGREMHLPVVDIFNLIQAVPDWKTAAMSWDGLHLGPVAQKVVYSGVLAAVRAHYHDL